MQLNERQESILSIVKRFEPITSDQIAAYLGLTRAALRPDLAILTMSGILDAKPRVGYFYNEKGGKTLRIVQFENLLVKDVKSVPVVVKEDDTIYDAIVSMFINNDVGTLIVVSEGGRLEGVVSQKDLLKSLLGKPDLEKIPVSVVMTRVPNVITVQGTDTVLTAARKMLEYEIDCIPVVRVIEEQGKERILEVTGRITKTNITRVFVEMIEGK
ncbi:MAG: helix-turn-helix transcriptional regulator [Clostridia bacterium]|nr:helix-turn-helix transcriptional regulator [Clostridia bacterium]